MNDNYTHIVLLVDGSGSMEDTKEATINGLNTFIDSQKRVPENPDRNLSFDEDLGDSNKEVKCTVTLVSFRSGGGYYTGVSNGEPQEPYQYQEHYKAMDIKDIQPLTKDNYITHGGTPLVDAFCKAIMDCSAFINRMTEAERPGRVIFVSYTDGEENSSTKFNRSDLATKIDDMQKLNWQFLYLGANQDAIQESKHYAVARGQTLNFSTTMDSIEETFTALSDTVMLKRCVAPTAMFNCAIGDDSGQLIGKSITTTSDMLYKPQIATDGLMGKGIIAHMDGSSSASNIQWSNDGLDEIAAQAAYKALANNIKKNIDQEKLGEADEADKI